jgi:serine/threonine protein kinase
MKMAGLKETGLFRPTDGRLIAGRYRIVDPNPIGEGGMGVVYRGRDNRLNRDVAIKILHEKESRPEVIARFRRESEIVNSIGHDGLAIVFDCAQPEDSLIYIVMEFLDGETLRQCLDDRDQCAKLRHPQHIRHVGLRMLDTLAAVHMKNIVHRDLKPENVFLIGPLTRKYRVKIIDFGIAKFMETDVHLTRAGSVVGTPLYMSPEQVQGLPIDNRTDLYAVGCLLYEMATGRPPFVGDLCDVQQGHMHGMPEAPSDLNEEIPRALGAVIMKMMAKAPDARFPDAEATAEALEDAVPPDPLFWRNSRPPSPVSGRAVGPREPRLLPRDVRVEPRTPSDGEDDPAPTPTRLVPEEAAAARSLGDGDIGRAKTILTPTNGTTLEGHKGWVSKIPKGARWPLAILLALLVATGLVYLVLPSRSSSKETDTTADTRNTADATVRHDVIVIPQPVFVPMPPSHDAEAAAPDEVADASEAEAEATEADADAGEDVALTEATEAEVTTPPTPPADYVTHMALGEAAASAKNWRVAVDEFKAAAKAWPEGADAQRGLGNALLSLFRREEGEAAIRLYLELAPNAPDAPYYRSLIGIDEEQ